MRIVAERALRMLESIADAYELIIVDDGSPDQSGAIADDLEREHPGTVRVIHHAGNRGYGAALRTGAAACRYDWICMVDGDDEYDVDDLRKMLKLREQPARHRLSLLPRDELQLQARVPDARGAVLRAGLGGAARGACACAGPRDRRSPAPQVADALRIRLPSERGCPLLADAVAFALYVAYTAGVFSLVIGILGPWGSRADHHGWPG